MVCRTSTPRWGEGLARRYRFSRNSASTLCQASVAAVASWIPGRVSLKKACWVPGYTRISNFLPRCSSAERNCSRTRLRRVSYPSRKSQVVFRSGVNRMFTRFPQAISCFEYSVAASTPP